ncbi:Z-ring formation inhibitor MciZ [Paenibacillus agricola]|uniref:Z-ring formation inhibitor MciZ n=1 Tax=Paenibacillus agricola TaxID=2716264 RepID=A0ABX0IYN0_9BACL|nr:Z-ring formation inhibitor MciZ [Paenibacillus agricola]NHN28808.1 Z-ring formation inhibitor MciZ [Paenibacillus agricola]
MKTYISEKQLSMVGRVWEIRRYLKLAQRKLTKDTSLLTYLAEQTDYAHTKPSSLVLDEENTLTPAALIPFHDRALRQHHFMPHQQAQPTFQLPM